MNALTWTPPRRGVGAALVAATLVVSACGPGGLSKQTAGAGVGAVTGGLIGSTIGSGSGRTAAIIVGGLVGALVGSEIGRSLDEQDRLRAERATQYALEEGPSGEPVEWVNPDSGHSGFVTPAEPYRRAETVCRDYSHTVTIDGRAETVRGTACRQPDGSWRAVS